MGRARRRRRGLGLIRKLRFTIVLEPAYFGSERLIFALELGDTALRVRGCRGGQSVGSSGRGSRRRGRGGASLFIGRRLLLKPTDFRGKRPLFALELGDAALRIRGGSRGRLSL